MGPTRSNGNTKVGPCSMAKDLVPDELWMFIDPLLPPEPPRPNGGRPRSRPEKLHADKAYDHPRCRRFLRKRGIKARIARRGVESGEGLGRHR